MSTTLERAPEVLHASAPATTRRPTLRNVLLASGFAASLFYVAALVFSAARWEGYSSLDQTLSELFAVDAPSRPIFLAFSIPYGLLSLAFGIGVLWSARPDFLASARLDRRLRVAGWLLIGVGVVNQFGPFFPMHMREVIAAGGATFSDTMHIILTIVLSVLLVSAMGFSAFAFGKGFRVYSAITVLALIVFGGLTTTMADALANNGPTPWQGLYERVNLMAYLLWMAVLAIALLRRGPERNQGSRSEGGDGR